MEYTIGEVAKKMGISTYTLRYYDKEGLLPFVKRTASGIRIFDDSDFDFLHVIHCLKNTGMPINEIRTFIEWAGEGDSSLQKRYDMFESRKKAIDKQIAQFEIYRECIEYKCNYYKKAIAAGTEAIYKNSKEVREVEMPLRKIGNSNKKEDIS